MKVVFIGSVEFSRITLLKLIDKGADIVGIITKEKSDFNADFFDLATIAETFKIPFKYVSNINSNDTLDWIKSLNPEIIFCFGWSNLLKKEILEVAPKGVVGFHPTLLPFNKGRHPLIWAKILGLEKSGCTFFFMDEGADTGDILSQKEFKINFEDDASVLYKKMIDTALIQIDDFFPKLENNSYEKIKQDTTAGNNWRKRTATDGKIDFRMSSESICNLVRGLSKPYVGAHCTFRNVDNIIWSVELGKSQENNLEPGKVIAVFENKIEVKTGNGSVILTNHTFTELPHINEYIL